MAFDQTIREHDRMLAIHAEKHEAHELNIDKLWKHKVGVDRYVWVERLVTGIAGALLYFAFQKMTGG